MGWITLSLRKLVLVQRVSQLEQRLVTLSQENQSTANSSAYAQRALGLRKQQAYSLLMQRQSNNMQNVSSQYSSGNATNAQLAQYMTDVQQAQLDYMYNKMMIDSVFTAQEQALQDQVNQKQSFLDGEQEQVETQLEAARAELKQMDEAISQDIEQSTISLV